MDNIQKLIASTEINHGGVKATEIKLEVMTRVIEVLVEIVQSYEKALRSEYPANADELAYALEKANEIAGEI